MELGGAKFTEADIGLPFYPGAKPTEGSAMRVATGDSVSLQTRACAAPTHSTRWPRSTATS